MRNLLFRTSLALAVIAPNAPVAAVAPPGFLESTYASNDLLRDATGLAWAPDGSNRLFVTRKGGEVRVVKTGVVQTTAFAVLPQVFTNSECGLIGMCFDPDFLTNRYVYFFVTVSAAAQQIVRYTDNQGIGTNPVVIIPKLPTDGQNHDGGGIGIGPDGHLYWAIGDLGNGTGVNANLTSLAAKVGRANRFTGAPIAGNPFNDGAGPNNEYIWARGLRNPFTLTFHPITGDLWVNVVGTSYEQVFVVNQGDHAGYNEYENNQPAGYLTPKIAYRTNGTDTRTIITDGAERTANLATFTTSSNHRFRAGQKITIEGVEDASFDGTFFVQSVPSPKTFTMAQVAADATSGGGNAKTASLGGCVTGGVFYDSTLLSADYRGNFFFGDYNSGQIMRATVSGASDVTSVDTFITGAPNNVDVTTGPDGALYYIGVANATVKRLVPETIPQTLVVHPTALRVQEGGRSLFTVGLSQAPAEPVTVNVSKRDGGYPQLGTTTTSLTFTPENWDQLQAVTIVANLDEDEAFGSAHFDLMATGFDAQTVMAFEIDGPTQISSRTSTLYRTGDQVPGEDEGTIFKTFGLPSLDGDRVGFLANIQSATGRIPAIIGGQPIGVLARKGGDAPGTDGVFMSFKDPVFNGGRFTFAGKLKPGSGISVRNDDGIWSDVSGTLQLIAREGESAPGCGGATFLKFPSLALPGSNGALFIGQLKPGTGTGADKVHVNNDSGLWRETGEGSELVIREGASITLEVGDSRTVKRFHVLGFIAGSEDQRRSHSADGSVEILVDFEDGTQAILASPGDGGPLVVKTATGDAIDLGETFLSLGIPATHDSLTAFKGRLNESANVTKDNDTGLFIGEASGEFESVVREGETAPFTGEAAFTDFSVPALASDGDAVVFHATLKKRTGTPVVTTTNDSGLWTNVSGTLKLIAREGATASGTSGFFQKFLSFAVYSAEAPTRAIAFTAALRLGKGQVSSRNQFGLWAVDKDGNTVLIQRSGDVITWPGDMSTRVISQLALKAAPQSAGQGRALNDLGQIVYLAKFQRGGQGIFMAQMP